MGSISSRPVPAEYLGLARLFRDGVRQVDRRLDALIDVVAQPLRARLARHPALRPEQPMSVIRAWGQTVPATLRIGPPRVARARTEFSIAETRITVSWLNDRAWGTDEDEPGLGICALVFAVYRGELVREWQPLTNVSFHAMARWFERTGKREPELLLADLTTLAQAAEDGGEKVYCPPRGIWLGEVIKAYDDTARRDVKLRNVRTWVEA